MRMRGYLFVLNHDFVVAMEILECFALIALISSKERITKVGCKDNVSDCELIKDCFDSLLDSDEFKNVQRVNAHMFFSHFADFSMWRDSCMGNLEYQKSCYLF